MVPTTARAIDYQMRSRVKFCQFPNSSLNTLDSASIQSSTSLLPVSNYTLDTVMGMDHGRCGRDALLSEIIAEDVASFFGTSHIVSGGKHPRPSLILMLSFLWTSHYSLLFVICISYVSASPSSSSSSSPRIIGGQTCSTTHRDRQRPIYALIDVGLATTLSPDIVIAHRLPSWQLHTRIPQRP